MHCPKIQSLPPPAFNKKGWPWAAGVESLPENSSKSRSWPIISIVTPSFNQGQFLEDTIRSVLLQGYPCLEYIIIDGGSEDNSVDIIKKYEEWLTFWVSEPDDGQSAAINKGFERATGRIWGYINSDDYYESGVLRTVAETFLLQEDTHLVVGQCAVFEDDKEIRLFQPDWPDNLDHFLLPFGSTFAQPASFWSRDIHLKVNGFDPSLHYCFDREFFLKIGLAGVRPVLLDKVIARYRQHNATKTNQTIRFYEESIPVIEEYAEDCNLSEQKKARLLKNSLQEIAYLEVFITWKRRGRLAAVGSFLIMAFKFPALMLQRKVIGQGRRLLCFRAKDVIELNNV